MNLIIKLMEPKPKEKLRLWIPKSLLIILKDDLSDFSKGLDDRRSIFKNARRQKPHYIRRLRSLLFYQLIYGQNKIKNLLNINENEKTQNTEELYEIFPKLFDKKELEYVEISLKSWNTPKMARVWEIYTDWYKSEFPVGEKYLINIQFSEKIQGDWYLYSERLKDNTIGKKKKRKKFPGLIGRGKSYRRAGIMYAMHLSGKKLFSESRGNQNLQKLLLKHNCYFKSWDILESEIRHIEKSFITEGIFEPCVKDVCNGRYNIETLVCEKCKFKHICILSSCSARLVFHPQGYCNDGHDQRCSCGSFFVRQNGGRIGCTCGDEWTAIFLMLEGLKSGKKEIIKKFDELLDCSKGGKHENVKTGKPKNRFDEWYLECKKCGQPKFENDGEKRSIVIEETYAKQTLVSNLERWGERRVSEQSKRMLDRYTKEAKWRTDFRLGMIDFDFIINIDKSVKKLCEDTLRKFETAREYTGYSRKIFEDSANDPAFTHP
jgi:hypothetical protein